MKILLIADRPGWAYDTLAQSIKKHSIYPSIEIQYISDLRLNPDSANLSDFDVVFFFLWYDAMRYGMKIKGFDFRKTCVGIHSISSWKNRGLNENQTSLICNQFAACGYISQEIGGLLDPKNGFYTPNGVERVIFFPSEYPEFNQELRLMWVGNPGRAHHGENKAFFHLVKPVIEEYSDRGVKLLVATHEQKIDHSEMGKFYRANHVLICASLFEGGPLPVIESLACGRPVVSTNVGIVPEVITNGENGFIFPRTKTGLRQIIEMLLANPSKLSSMASKCADSVSDRFSESMAKSYDSMFKFVFESSR